MMKPTKTPIDTALIREIATLLSGSDLTEIEVQNDDLRIRVVRAPAHVTVAAAPMMAAAAPAAPAPAPTMADAGAIDFSKHPGVVTSPMVGTIYLAPEPGAANFVSVGTQVREGQSLLIVEAMKTMNAIPAPRAGTVTRILVDNGHPVEYGEPLLIIE